MPPELSMRHTKLKAEEAALLAGEINKPSWESRNEGIHERVSFEDTIWGFDLAGGSFYKTPLRVTHVKEGSRAEKAGIRPGDKLKRINDIDTSTLTIQEAHEIILESGIHLKIAVTAPEDEEDAYYCYEDPVDTGYDSEEERRREEERAKKRQVHARVSSYWSLQWPWVSKRRVIYRESNCFMVPSKYETKHIEKFPPVPFLRQFDDHIKLDSVKNTNLKSATNPENQLDGQKSEETANGVANGVINGAENGIKEASPTPKLTHKPVPKGEEPPLTGGMSDGYLRLMNGEDDIITNKTEDNPKNVKTKGLNDIQEVDEANIPLTPEPQDHSIQEISEAEPESVAEESLAEESVVEVSEAEVSVAEASEVDVSAAEASEVEVSESPVVVLPDEPNGDVEAKDDDIIEELLNGDEVSESHEEILDSILSETQEEDTSTADER